MKILAVSGSPLKISEDSPQVEDVTVYLRVNGLSTEAFTPNYQQGVKFHPSIPTTAVVYFVGLQEETAQDLIKKL